MNIIGHLHIKFKRKNTVQGKETLSDIIGSMGWFVIAGCTGCAILIIARGVAEFLVGL